MGESDAKTIASPFADGRMGKWGAVLSAEYAFEVEKETYTDEHGLCVCYPTEYVGTDEEEKLKSLLDEVAKSFKLI